MSAKKNHCRVCFISLSSYPLLAGRDMGFVGGAEVLLVQLAKGIARQGFEVSFVTYSDGGDQVELIDGIKVIKAYKQQDALSLSPLKKVWHIWKALRVADADVYLEHPGLGGVVSLFCRLCHRKAILYIGSEAEVVKRRIVTNGKLYFSLGHGFDIKAAHVVIAQSEYQRKMLRENFHRDSVIVKIPIPLSEPAMPAWNGTLTVLWLATVKPLKQAELFLDLARAMPQAKFQMVGGPALGDERYYNSIKEAAAAIPNLEFCGFVPHEKIGSYIAKSNILVNTSIVEGFPVTFLEAWAASISRSES
jgi:glycosyltransferase involved in cell wall biosynthesis